MNLCNRFLAPISTYCIPLLFPALHNRFFGAQRILEDEKERAGPEENGKHGRETILPRAMILSFLRGTAVASVSATPPSSALGALIATPAPPAERSEGGVALTLPAALQDQHAEFRSYSCKALTLMPGLWMTPPGERQADQSFPLCSS